MSNNEPEKSIYYVAKEKEGVVQLISETVTTDRNIATEKAKEFTRDNSHDYLVLKVVSKHKKRIITDDIIYD